MIRSGGLTSASKPRATLFRRACLHRLNARAADLSGAQLLQADLHWVHFRKAKLRRVKFQGA
ncbi:pentapeptide repeat-containing protein [Marinobacter mobilis]|uniref:pentapeptide repeat-containing protein n=1 Tax=Marinobacter mobilis TaxID=488533 RepID=UPI003CCB781C